MNTRWRTYRDEVEKTEFNKGYPHTEGVMDFSEKNPGFLPPSDRTFNEWTQCDYDAWEAVSLSLRAESGVHHRRATSHTRERA